MADLQQRILDIIHKPQLAALATVTEQNNPWVRYADDAVIHCQTKKEAEKILLTNIKEKAQGMQTRRTPG